MLKIIALMGKLWLAQVECWEPGDQIVCESRIICEVSDVQEGCIR